MTVIPPSSFGPGFGQGIEREPFVPHLASDKPERAPGFGADPGTHWRVTPTDLPEGTFGE